MNNCSGARIASSPIAMRIMVRASSTMLAGEQIARADREHDKAGGEIGGVQHMREGGTGKLGLKMIASQSSG